MSDNKRTGRSFNGKGYYIALILCAVAIGISGYLYYQNTMQQEANLLLQEETQEQQVLATMGNEALEAIATQSPMTQSTTPPSQSATQPGEKKVLKTAAPVDGQTIASYAMDCLSYNETTRDWRVHNGVDIGAQEGTQVMAAADGKVIAVYEDDTMGYTVEIRHEGGYTTRYASLAEAVSVQEGDTVKLGQVIGCVGDTALVESVIGHHVHFSVTYQDAPMDPADFLNLA